MTLFDRDDAGGVVFDQNMSFMTVKSITSRKV